MDTESENRDEIRNLRGSIARVGFFRRHSVKNIVSTAGALVGLDF